MILQILLLRKLFAALGAAKGLLPGVNPLVLHKLLLGQKRLVALLAGEDPLTRVTSLVKEKFGLSFEGLLALWAGKRMFALVGFPMRNKTRFQRERLPTL